MLKKIYQRLKQKGQGVVEYALLLGVVAVLVVGFLTEDGLVNTFRTTLSNVVEQFTTFNDAYDNANTNTGGNSGGTENAGAGEENSSGDGNNLDGT